MWSFVWSPSTHGHVCSSPMWNLWTGNHMLKYCKAAISEQQCISCITYNKHHPHTQIETTHSSLDKRSPSLIAVLDKYKKNIDYETKLIKSMTSTVDIAEYWKGLIKCIQVNFKHSRVATDNVTQITATENIDKILVQGTYLYQEEIRWVPRKYRTYSYGEENRRAAIIIANNSIGAILITKYSKILFFCEYIKRTKNTM